MAKRPVKTAEKLAEEELAAQVLAQMGEEIEGGPGFVKGGRVTNMSPRERMLASQTARMGTNVEDDPTDGMIMDSIATTLDELGDDAYAMGSADLLDAIGRTPDTAAVAALDKLDPEDRIAVLRMMDVGSGDTLEEDAAQMAARRPLTSARDRASQEEVEMDVLRNMGVK